MSDILTREFRFNGAQIALVSDRAGTQFYKDGDYLFTVEGFYTQTEAEYKLTAWERGRAQG